MNLVLLVFWILSSLASPVIRPTWKRCEPGFWLDMGVRPTGGFSCHRIGAMHETRTQRGGWIDDSPVPPEHYEETVYCTGGQEPIQRDGVIVSCQARH